MKNEKQTSNVNFNVQSTYFDVFCLNFSIETKIKTLFLISYFNLSKKQNGILGKRILLVKTNLEVAFYSTCPYDKFDVFNQLPYF